MTADCITVQPCGCIALPEEVAVLYGMLPGAVLVLHRDDEHRSVTLEVAQRAPAESSVAAACPVLS